MWLGRWLDPPEIRERKRLMRAGLLPRPEPVVSAVGVAVPVGCMVPLAIAAAVLVGAGVDAKRRGGSHDPVCVRHGPRSGPRTSRGEVHLAAIGGDFHHGSSEGRLQRPSRCELHRRHRRHHAQQSSDARNTNPAGADNRATRTNIAVGRRDGRHGTDDSIRRWVYSRIGRVDSWCERIDSARDSDNAPRVPGQLRGRTRVRGR